MIEPRPRHQPARRQSAINIAAMAVAVALLLLYPGLRAQGDRAAEHWVGTWATAVVSSQQVITLPPILTRQPPPAPAATPPPAAAPAPPPPIQAVSNQTFREIVHPSLGGSRYRVVFTNQFGTAPLAIGAAQLAIRTTDAGIVAGSGRPLLFAGKASATIPVGAVMVSDPVDFTAASFADLAIDVYLPGDTAGMPLTMHTTGLQTNYLSQPGNHVGKLDLPIQRTTLSSFFLSRVEVVAPASVGAVVAFGDSITDGTASTPDTNHRWPDYFARRVSGMGGSVSVLNLGISGNRLMSDGFGINALARFDRDVASQSGVTHMIVLEGINDIGFAGDDALPSGADVIAAQQQLIARAHARGLKIFGATLTPFEGARYYTTVGEAKRQEVNKWIRTSGAYDGVVDFDAAVRDPGHPGKGLASFDPGDHLHFTDTGYQRMSEVPDLKFFKAGVAVGSN